MQLLDIILNRIVFTSLQHDFSCNILYNKYIIAYYKCIISSKTVLLSEDPYNDIGVAMPRAAELQRDRMKP